MAQESRLVIVIDAKNAERNARNLGNELDSIERKGDFATKSMDALSVATRQLAGYMAGLVTVSAAISKMDTYTGLQNRLKLVTNNQVELNKATEDTFRIAQKTYSAWDSVLQVYQRFSDNAKTLNLTMDDTARLTETVSKAVAISGASAAAADAALVQFGQALASGTLRGEELNSVMEQTPALAKAIAQGMGITVGELRTVAAEGKITSQEIVKALKNVQADVDALFAKTDITISQSLTLLNNEITKFVGESGKGSGAAEVLSGSIKTLAGNLDVLTSGVLDADLAFAKTNEEREKAAQAHADRMFSIDADYQRKKLELEMSYGEKITGSMVGMLEAAGDKQSAIYKAMFTANKAFAIAQSLISIQAGIAQAANNPFPYNLVAMASVAAETASIVGNIQSVAGIFHGGKDYVPKEATYLLDKGERVVSPRQNQDLTSFLASQREMNQYNAINSNPTNGSSEVNIQIINRVQGVELVESQGDDGTVTIEVVRAEAQRAVKQGFANLGNQNSFEAKQVKRAFNVAPKH